LKAKAILPDSVDVKVTLGDLYSSSGNLEEGKKLFEDAYTHNRKDPQALLAMGNYWYNTYSMKKNEDSLRLSYKFFHPVLTEHVRSAYAANGLGIVCANKNEMDAAREIFSKVMFHVYHPRSIFNFFFRFDRRI
jgi:tetratricopeptide (TPR) repeat protein